MATGDARDLITVNKIPNVHAETEVLSYFSDFQNNKGNWETMIGTNGDATSSGTITFWPLGEFDQAGIPIVGYAKLELPNDAKLNQASFGSQPQVPGGALVSQMLHCLGAMTMEYKVVAITANDFAHRISLGFGRHHAHSTAITSPEDTTISWQKYYGSTWLMCVANTITNNLLPNYRVYVDTGISAFDWHVLRIDVSEDWDKIEFFCDGERTGCFLRSQYPNAFPANPPAIVDTEYGNFICGIRQSTPTPGGTTGAAEFRLDYASAKYFINRKIV